MHKKIAIIIVILSATINLVIFGAGLQNIDPDTPIDVPNINPDVHNDTFGFGVAIGKGCGLAGGYLYARPWDMVGLEVAGGIRIFQIYGSFVVNGMNHSFLTYFPFSITPKAQFYFSSRKEGWQHGVETGITYADDAGPGMEVSYFSRWKFAGIMNVELMIGSGYYFDPVRSMRTYISRQGINPDGLTIESQSFFIMWGIALGFSFF